MYGGRKFSGLMVPCACPCAVIAYGPRIAWGTSRREMKSGAANDIFLDKTIA
jgi:hypothetical protein